MIEPQISVEQVPTSAPTTKSEWPWVWAWSAVTLTLTFLPFLWAWWSAPPDTQFMGFLFNATDGNSYLAKMQQGYTGQWLFHLTYSPEPTTGAFIFVPYLLLGKLAALIGLSNVLMFHLARLGFGLGLLLTSYRFIATFFSERKQKRLAFLLVCFGAGIGWLLLPFVGLASTDLWVAESLSFFSILANPHFPLATTLLILAILWLRDVFETSGKISWLKICKAALAAFVLGWVHPFLLISLGAIMGVYLLRLNFTARKFSLEKWLGLILVGLVGAPGPVYTFVATNADPVLRAWMSQNQTLSPWFWFYLSGYGLLAILAAVGAWRVEREDWSNNEASLTKQRDLQLLTTWVVVTIVLLYLPVSFQRRFVEGLHLPLVCLATFGFYELFWPWRKKRYPKANLQRWSNRLLIFCSISTLVTILILVSYIAVRQDVASGAPTHPLYYYNGEVAALNWLGTHTQTNDVVIAGPIDGNYIPARAGNQVFYGHELETIDRAHKAQLLAQFFRADTLPTIRTQMIQEYHLHYLYYGVEEKHLLDAVPAFDPSGAGWPVAFQNEWVTIYKLN